MRAARLLGRYSLLLAATLCLSCSAVDHKRGARDSDLGLWPLCERLKGYRLVDLTHAFGTDIPHWKGFPPMKVRDVYTYEKGGFWAQEFTHVGQWGTHVDPPAHFHKGLRTIDEISLVEMILPLVVIDVHEKAVKDPDYVLSPQDILDWEARHGRIPEGAFVAMRTGWAKRWPDNEAMHNKDDQGVAHYPGWSLEALEFLYENRGITASGHETTDTDPGMSTSKGNYDCESYILGQNHYQIALLSKTDFLDSRCFSRMYRPYRQKPSENGIWCGLGTTKVRLFAAVCLGQPNSTGG